MWTRLSIFTPRADAGFVEGSAVDGGVGADFDGVFDDETSLLRKLDVLAGGFVADVAESVGAEHGSGVDDDAVAELDAGIEDDARMDAAFAADDDAATDDCAGADGRAFADFRFGLDDSVRADADAAAEEGRSVDDGRGMNHRVSIFGAEQLRCAGEGEAGIALRAAEA